jgi:hypothetical protein
MSFLLIITPLVNNKCFLHDIYNTPLLLVWGPFARDIANRWLSGTVHRFKLTHDSSRIAAPWTSNIPRPPSTTGEMSRRLSDMSL